jgi:hypothetical protein
MKLEICNRILLKQYVVALLVLGLALLVLAICPQSRISLPLPDKTGFVENPWNGHDVNTYVNPAKKFLEYGEFSRDGKPDMHRTIGYPLFLAIMMATFGKYWLIATYVVQIFIFSTLFPAAAVIYNSWFKNNPPSKFQPYYILLLSGVGISYVGQILTDQIFTSLLTLGIALGMISVIRRSWLFAFLHILIISFAAQIRPTLALFWIADLLFMLHVCSLWQVRFSGKIKAILLTTVIAICIAGNAPAIRNYVNHRIFTATDIFSNNLAHYLAGPVLIGKNLGEDYLNERERMNQLPDDKRIAEQKRFAWNVLQQYPLEATKRVFYHFVWNLYEPHWEYILFVFGKGFAYNSWFDKNGNLRWSIFLSIPFVLFYSFIYVLGCIGLLKLIQNRNFTLVAGIIVYLLPLAVSLINGQGARMRLCVEPGLIILACYSVSKLQLPSRS